MKIKLKRFFRSYLFINIVIVTILSVILGYGIYYECTIISIQRQEYRSKVDQLDECEKNIARLSAELAALEKQKANLEHADGILDAARDKLGMANKGEIVCLVEVEGVPEAEMTNQETPAADNYRPGNRPSGFFFDLFGPIIF
ncbi:MAG: septum formation initiator family protein [Candidatus Bruticola sp.]